MARRQALLGSRLVEWGILALVILVLAGCFGYYAYRVQGQAERAAVISTLGALRTALVLDQLRQAVATPSTATAPNRDPFAALERLPANYAGRRAGQKLEEVVAGQWVFDEACVCVGYKPLHGEWLESFGADQLLWFQVTAGDGGVRQLHAQRSYLWQGQTVE